MTDQMTLETAAQKLQGAGYGARLWKGQRLYITSGSKQVGYITQEDLVRGIESTRILYRGEIARILRDES